jgi:bifunctional non-homologous end joining protein LigD
MVAVARSDDPSAPLRFVVQKHWARSLHYDLRLEIAGQLVSWAVPKGPTKDPKVRRLALRMPDHPLDYSVFEGTIAAGEYGAGVVMIWDAGSYEPLLPAGVTIEQWLDRGFLRFILHGTKLHGLWEMLRYESASSRGETWLWVKIRDRFARPGYTPDDEPNSAASGKTAEELAGSGTIRAPASRPPPLESWGRACAEGSFDSLE